MYVFLATLLTTVLLPLLTSAAVLNRRELLNGLTINYGPAGPIYQSTNELECAPQRFQIGGSGDEVPYQLDAVAFPLPTNGSAPTVYEIGTWLRHSNDGWPTARWVSDKLPVGLHFVVRAIDRTGTTRYSKEKWVLPGDRTHCKPLHPNWWEKLGFFTRTLIILAGLTVLLVVSRQCLAKFKKAWIAWKEHRQEVKQVKEMKRQEAAAAAAGSAPLLRSGPSDNTRANEVLPRYSATSP
ncbi:hypothetical protein JCM8547_005392 [Rhodosporidiobolus lusitaniae]